MPMAHSGRDDMRFADEYAPLLAHSQLASVPEEEADEGAMPSSPPFDFHAVPPSRLHRKFRKTLTIPGGLRKVSPIARTRDGLPLYSRTYDPPTPVWKKALRALGALFLLVFVISSTFLLDTVKHPTGPFPAPPTPSEPPFPAPPPELPPHDRITPKLIKAKNGAVATENEICSNIGVDVLKEGGNAVDAAIASTFCIGVVSMYSSGIGGGGFMTVRLPPSKASDSSSVWTIDFRETAPALSNETMYAHDPMASKYGGLAVGVPGEIRGLEEAHRRWGTMPWKRLIQPSVDLASGWAVGKELAWRIQVFKPLMLSNSDWKDVFAPNGKLLEEGEIIRRTNLSRTLATIAEEGPDAFYKGPIADAIVAKAQATGGILTHDDLESYKVIVQHALEGTFKGKKVYTSNAPTSGPALLHILNLLERYNLKGEGRSGLNTHRVVEAIKFGFAARTKICDPRFLNDTTQIEEISTKHYSNLIRSNITDETTHTPDYYHPIYDIHEDHGTSHTSVIDKDGMAVSLTSTVNLIFGSGVMDPVTGIILNDEMDDFSTPGEPNAFGLWPSPFNYPEPGKRPLSSTSPTIIEHEDGSVYFSLGGSGGSRIFPAVLQVILGVDRWGLDISQAIEFGRVHDQLYPMFVDVDSNYPEEGIEALRERGHNVTVSDINRIAAVVQGVMKEGDTIYAASDSRKNGIAAGY